MNFMGMNNNLSDDLSSRIKIIIEPYEKKIKDLEEQIRQKDFEIAVLKEKLNKSVNNNIQPMNTFPQQMGMGMGFAHPMMNMSMNLNNDFKLIVSFGLYRFALYKKAKLFS